MKCYATTWHHRAGSLHGALQWLVNWRVKSFR